MNWKEFLKPKGRILKISLIFAIVMFILFLPLVIVPVLTGYRESPIVPPFGALSLIPLYILIYSPFNFLASASGIIEYFLIPLYFVYFFLLAFLPLKIIGKIFLHVKDTELYINLKELLKPTKRKLIIFILIILLIVVGISLLMIGNIKPVDGKGWSKKCQSFGDCAFIEKANVPVPGPEGCYSIKENPVIQNQNLISTREECECINNVCQVKPGRG